MLILKAYRDRRLIGRTINLSHPETLDINGIQSKCLRRVGKRRDDIRVVVENGTVADTFYNYADTSVMQKEFGLLPETNLADGVRMLLEKKAELTMCGIFVVIDKSHAAIDETAAQEALSILKDRGPDLCFVMRPRRHVFIGQTVLSLVGVARDAKTNTDFQSASSRFSLSFNGEIYNYRDLQRRFAIDGGGSKGLTDTHVLSRLHDVLPVEDIPEVLDGYAYAVFDDRDNAPVYRARHCR